MDLLLPLLTGLTVTCALLAIFRSHHETAVERRIGLLSETAVGDAPLAQPFSSRVLLPALRRLGSISPGPDRLVQVVQRRLEQAGRPATTAQFFGVWLAAGALPPMLFLAAVVAGGRAPDARVVFGLAGLAAFGLYVPWTWLRRRAASRRRAVARALPDAIDLLITNLEAGLGLQAALLAVADRARGPLAIEFGRVVREVSVGRPRAEALSEMGARLDIPEARLFARAMTQAEQTGIPIARVLRNHSREMRQRRQVAARDQAAKIPVKMVAATVFFMFPTLFMLLLGPVVLNVIGFFKQA